MKEHRGAHRILSPSEVSETATRGVILVGEDNPQSADPEYALYHQPDGCAGHRLQSQILRLPARYYLSLWRTNLCNPSWNRDQAEARSFEILAADAPWATVIMLGRKVAGVFKLVLNETVPVFGSARVGRHSREFTVISLPHPSGRCRDWNHQSAYDAAARLLSLHCPEIPWGGVH